MYDKKLPVSVMIVSSSDKADQYLRDMLPQQQFYPVDSVTNAGEAKRAMLERPADIVIINTPLPDDFGTQLAFDIVQDTSAGVLLFVKNEIYEQVAYKAEDYGVLTLARPSNRQAIFQALKLLIAMRARLRKLEEKASNLETKMKEIRLINHAKWLLIDRLRMNEAEAHHYIEKAAMDRCVKKQEIAENIIKTYDN